jgi:hypothetical protein
MSPIYTEQRSSPFEKHDSKHPCYEPLLKHTVKQNEIQLRGKKVILNPLQQPELFPVSLMLLQDTCLRCVSEHWLYNRHRLRNTVDALHLSV